MKKKIILPMMLVLGVQMPIMATSGQNAQPAPQQTSWTKIGLYSAGTALGSYGLLKGYKWLTFKKPVPQPTFFEKLAAQVPGGTVVLNQAQKASNFAKKHSYISSACALVGLGWLGYNYILKPEMRAMQGRQLKEIITGICDHSFAVKGHSVARRMSALGSACEYAKGLAAELDDVALIRSVNELINFYTKKAPKDEEALLTLGQQLGTKQAALFRKIDQVIG